jgi:hypothetical protein
MSQRQQGRGQRRSDDGRGCAAVRKQIVILLGRQQRIDGNRDDAGADRAPKGDRMIDGIVEQQDDAVFRAHIQSLQCRRETPGARLQLRVGERPLRVRERDLVAKAARDIGVDKIGGGVVRPALQDVFKHWRHESTRDLTSH